MISAKSNKPDKMEGVRKIIKNKIKQTEKPSSQRLLHIALRVEYVLRALPLYSTVQQLLLIMVVLSYLDIDWIMIKIFFKKVDNV